MVLSVIKLIIFCLILLILVVVFLKAQFSDFKKYYLLSLSAILMYHIHTIKQVADSLLRKKTHSEDSTKQKQQNSHAFPDG